MEAALVLEPWPYLVDELFFFCFFLYLYIFRTSQLPFTELIPWPRPLLALENVHHIRILHSIFSPNVGQHVLLGSINNPIFLRNEGVLKTWDFFWKNRGSPRLTLMDDYASLGRAIIFTQLYAHSLNLHQIFSFSLLLSCKIEKWALSSLLQYLSCEAKLKRMQQSPWTSLN